MPLLMVGRTTLLSQTRMEDYFPGESIVISTAYPSSFHTSRHHVTTTDITYGQNGWERMFEIHDFGSVIYLSGLLDPLGGEPRETAQLFETLLYASQRGVKHFYICLPDMTAEKTGTGRMDYAEGLRNVALLFSGREGFDVKIITIPYITNPDDKQNFVLSIRDTKSLKEKLPWKKGAEVSFAEAGAFLSCMKTVTENDESPEKELTMAPQYTVTYDDDMFKEEHLLACSHPGEIKPSLLSRQRKGAGNGSLSWLFSLLILTGGAFFTEAMIYQLQSLPFLNSVDLRFIYILVIALSGSGMSGFLAAVIECLFLLRIALAGGSTNFMIFFNPDNWSTYLLYILFGTGIGYSRGHQRQETEIIQMERDFEKEQNQELRDLYQQLLDKKNEYRVNLENSKMGFGKLYQAFTRLSSVEPEQIMAESIPVLEDLLENQTVSVYSVYESNRDSARLQVASRSIYKDMPRSIMVSDHPDMMQALLRDTIWFNRGLNKNDPMYAAPIIDQGKLIAFIVIKEANFYQTSLYYQNLLFVLSRIMGSLIITALNYQRQIQEQNFIEGTNVLNRDAMKHRMSLLEKMKDNKISSYRILEISKNGMTVQELDQKLRHLIRPLDVVGQPEEGDDTLLLIAANADDVGAQIVKKRLTGAGLVCEIMR